MTAVPGKTDWADKVFRGDVVTSSRIIRDGFVACVGERIAAVGTGTPPPSPEVVDWRGKYIFPGIVDGHMHTSIQGWSGIAGATRSAAAGGITTVVDMPYDTPKAVTNARFCRPSSAMLASPPTSTWRSTAPSRPM
jgi:allantoinase